MKIPTIHQTDVFHPHADPDDHWDLACQFALSQLGRTDLKGILIDHPPSHVDCGDPAAHAVAQLNHLTGQWVPFSVGIPAPYPEEPEKSANNGGIRMLLKMLDESTEKIVIHIVGSCRDVAIAGMLRPDLFREKCKAVYLNAGSAFSDPQSLEYNVQLDPLAFHRIFSLPCPIYWMPCFGEQTFFKTSRYGTYYNFLQKDILNDLSSGLAQYFVYALERIRSGDWLEYLMSDPDPESLERCGAMTRNMWCTGGFFHAAGLGVDINGEILGSDKTQKDPVFRFIPIRASCGADGVVTWENCTESTDRYIFCVEDIKAYPGAMIKAMKKLLMNIQ